MVERIEETVKREEQCFNTPPKYTAYKIRYVGSKDDADICISRGHTLADYILIGFVALAKTVDSNDSEEIKVYNMRSSKKENVLVCMNGDKGKVVEMDSELFLQLNEPVTKVYSNLYTGKMKGFGLGVSMSISLMSEFAGISSIPKEVLDKLVFENFDDTKTAQQNALYLLISFHGASIRGILSEF